MTMLRRHALDGRPATERWQTWPSTTGVMVPGSPADENGEGEGGAPELAFEPARQLLAACGLQVAVASQAQELPELHHDHLNAGVDHRLGGSAGSGWRHHKLACRQRLIPH